MPKPDDDLDQLRRPQPKRLEMVNALNIVTAFKKFVAEHPEPTADEIHEFCCVWSRANKIRREDCDQCHRQLTTRQMYRPCPGCGFNNYLKAEQIRLDRKSIREAAKKGRDDAERKNKPLHPAERTIREQQLYYGWGYGFRGSGSKRSNS